MTEPDSSGKKGFHEQRRSRPLFVGLFLIVLLAAAAAFVFGGDREQGASPSGQSGPSRFAEQGQPARSGGREPAAKENSGHPSQGGRDAPVTMLEYSDYQ